MKAFIASLVLLAVLMVCSVLNCFYIDRVTGKMLALCAEFPEKAAEGEEEMPEVLKAALSEWEKAKPRLRAASKASSKHITPTQTSVLFRRPVLASAS